MEPEKFYQKILNELFSLQEQWVAQLCRPNLGLLSCAHKAAASSPGFHGSLGPILLWHPPSPMHVCTCVLKWARHGLPGTSNSSSAVLEGFVQNRNESSLPVQKSSVWQQDWCPSNSLNSSFVLALTVRFLTRRFIGEYGNIGECALRIIISNFYFSLSFPPPPPFPPNSCVNSFAFQSLSLPPPPHFLINRISPMSLLQNQFTLTIWWWGAGKFASASGTPSAHR